MISDPLERLRAANPEPSCPPPPIDEVWRRIEAHDYRTDDPLVARPGGLAGMRGRLRSTPGVLAVLASVAVVIAVATIALQSHGRGTGAGSSRGAHQLIAKLSVLRRPQTEADMLPSGLHIASPLSPQGEIIPRFTRLVRTLPDARFYLVVTTWSPDSTWSRRFGDQVAVVEISGSHATESMPLPAADLTNASEVWSVSPTRRQAPGTPGLYYVGVVPDGVAHVRWTFAGGVANGQFQAGASVDASVANNVAIIPAGPDTTPPVLRGAWYAPDGQRLPTSNRALLGAEAARNAAQRRQAIRSLSKHIYHADPSLLAAFAVFAITSPTGARTASGDIISHPPLSSLPLDVVQGAPAQRWQLDFTQVREVITPSGARLYVIPGQRGLCISSQQGGGSCNQVPGVQIQGIFFSGGSLGISRTYRLVPKTVHSITIRTSNGRQTIPVPDGVYVSSNQPSRR